MADPSKVSELLNFGPKSKLREKRPVAIEKPSTTPPIQELKQADSEDKAKRRAKLKAESRQKILDQNSRINALIPTDLHRRVKLESVNSATTMQVLITQALEEYLTKRKA